MFIMIGDHPEIEMIMRTGYSSFNQPTSHYCEKCGDCLDDMDMFEDENYEYLCVDCLLGIHMKE